MQAFRAEDAGCRTQGSRVRGCECEDVERIRRRARGHRTQGHRARSVCTRARTARMQTSHQQSHQVQTLAKLSLFGGAKEQRWVSNACVSKVSPTAVEWQGEPGEVTLQSTCLYRLGRTVGFSESISHARCCYSQTI